jgi:DNA-binding NarL/FixJ family response regulator
MRTWFTRHRPLGIIVRGSQSIEVLREARMTSSETLSIFIVEDHEMIRLGLKAGLERIEGFSIAGEAEDGLEAVEMICAQRPDVVLMDIELPGMDGIEATQRVKQRLPDLRVVMLTSHQEDEGIFAAFAAGADGYCLKGAPMTRLALAIRTVIDGAAWLDPAIASRVLREPARTAAASAPAAPKESEGLPPGLELSDREKDVLRLVAEGLSNPEIGKRLYLSAETVKSHLRRIMEKLVADDRTQAAVKALRQGLI